MTKYITSFVYCLTDFVSEISYTQPEKIYAVFQHLVYEAFFGYLVGTMATIVMAGRIAEQMKEEKLIMHCYRLTRRRKDLYAL